MIGVYIERLVRTTTLSGLWVICASHSQCSILDAHSRIQVAIQTFKVFGLHGCHFSQGPLDLSRLAFP